LEFAAAANGAIAKEPAHVWKMTGVAAGTAGWFRFVGNGADAGGTSTALARLDGSVGTANADLNMANVTVAVGTPITIDTFSYTVSAT
jgi:hypothetical protein